MNELPLTFGLLVGQIAAVGAVALLLDVWVARRSPAAASRLLLIALVAMPLLTIAAFCPWPVRWTMQAAAPAPANDVEPVSAAEPAHINPSGSGFDALALLRKLPRVEGRADSPRAGQALIAVWAIIVGVCTLRLAGGLWSVNRLRRSSRRIANTVANDLLAELSRDMGLQNSIELREADAPGLPATAGWRRPMILLPPGWREWTLAELRAALAHELAHIHAGDYLIGVIAKLVALPHGYHPLPRFLLARLRLRQELAADALGAAHAGGRREYVRALARLALREPAGAGVPAPLLVSAHGGALFRRIQMLRNTEEARPLSRAVRGLTLAVMVGSTLLVASLRGPAVEPKETATAAPSASESFDLSYLTGDTHAVACVRPGALLAEPGMDIYAKLIQTALEAHLKEQGRQMPDGVSLVDVDQIVADMQLSVQATGEKGKRSITLGSTHLMIRMKKDVDWPKVLHALFGEIETKHQDGTAIYLVKSPPIGPFPMPLVAVDARTLVMVHSDKDKYVLPTKGNAAERFGLAWKNVERSPFAIALDNRDRHWTKHLVPEMKEVPSAGDLVKSTETLCVGVGFEGGVRATAFVTGKDEAHNNECITAIGALSKLIRSVVEGERKAGSIKPEDEASTKMIEEMMNRAGVVPDGRGIKVTLPSSVKLAELVKSLNTEPSAEKK